MMIKLKMSRTNLQKKDCPLVGLERLEKSWHAPLKEHFN